MAGSVKTLLSLVEPIIVPKKHACFDEWEMFWKEIEAGMPAVVQETGAKETDPFIRYK